MRYSIILAVSIFILFPAFGFSTTIIVPDDYPEIQQAINAAVNGDTVLVRSGTYLENINFNGTDFHLISEHGPTVTTIDGNQAGSVVTFQSGESRNAILQGFSIRNGLATNVGGGIHITNSSPTIKDCTITGNDSPYNAGGAYCDSSQAIFVQCHFMNNTAGDDGAGFYCSNSSVSFAECVLMFNTAIDCGGALDIRYNSDVTIHGCVIMDNTAVDDDGGAIDLHDHSSLVVSHSIIIHNIAGETGGGLDCDYYTTLEISNSIIAHNSAQDSGGICIYRLSNATLINNVIIGNVSLTNGGGISCLNGSSANLINGIHWNNTASKGPEFYVGPSSDPSSITINYSDVENGQSSCYLESGSTLNWGVGMIDSDPLFVDQANDDFHLTYPSPCRDTGDNSAVSELFDFEGDPRIAYGTVDIGADEFYMHLYYTGDSTPGGNVDVKIIDLPSTAPVVLWAGSGVLDPPMKTMFGDWYLQMPVVTTLLLGSIPADGVLHHPRYIPLNYQCWDIPIQAIVGNQLTNLSMMEVN